MEPIRNQPPTGYRPINSNTTPNPTPNGAPNQVPTNGTRVSHQTTMKNSTKSGAEGPTQNLPLSEMLRPKIDLTGPIIVPNFEITESPAICEKWTSSRKVCARRCKPWRSRPVCRCCSGPKARESKASQCPR